jgi:hypothetical protein
MSYRSFSSSVKYHKQYKTVTFLTTSLYVSSTGTSTKYLQAYHIHCRGQGLQVDSILAV